MGAGCPHCGSERIGHEHDRVRGVQQGRERLICWDCGARFDARDAVDVQRERELSPSEQLSSRVRIVFLVVALASLAFLAILGLYALGFFDWVQCSVDNTADC